MKERLMQLPEEIAQKRVILLNLNEEIEALKATHKQWEADLTIIISNEVDDKGKPLHSNAEKRQAELINRIRGNSHMKSVADAMKQKTMMYEIEKIELEKLQNTQSNLRAITRLGGEE